jgi:integrase
MVTEVSEGPIRIGRGTIEAAGKRHQTGARLIIRDKPCPGLSLVVNPKGMVWRLEWRPRGSNPITGKRWPVQKITLGNPETHSPDGARDEASRLKGQAKAGADPGADRRKRIAESSRQRASTVGSLIDGYERELPTRPKLRGTGVLGADYAQNEIANLRLAVAAMNFASRPVTELSPADIGRLLTARAKQPATARKHFGALSRFLDWAAEHGYIDLNPCLRMPKGKRPRAVPSRPNCPTLAELAAIWLAAGVLSGAERDLIRWLIAVPCRLREATRLGWSHVTLRDTRVDIPGPMMKSREPHRFHIPPFALAILQERHAAAGEPLSGLVFPAARSKKPIEAMTKIKCRVSDKSGVAGWTPHDFRRSFASTCAELGIAESVADAVLSHRQSATRAGVLGVYQRSTRWPEQIAAMNAWNAALQAAVIGVASRG